MSVERAGWTRNLQSQGVKKERFELKIILLNIARDSKNRETIENDFMPGLTEKQRLIFRKRFWFGADEKRPSLRELAEDLHVAFQAVQQADSAVWTKLQRFIRGEPLEESRANKFRIPIAKEDLELLSKQGKTLQEKADHFGVSIKTIEIREKHYGVRGRKRGRPRKSEKTV